MVTISQENKRTEITNGNSIQMPTCSVMEKRELKMELPWLFMLNDMKINSQKLQLLKRPLKIIKQLPKTCQENQKIQVRVKFQEDQISYMVSKMFKVTIHGMLEDVFMENHLPRKYFQTMILVSQLNQTAEMLLDQRRIKLDHLDAQQSVKTSHSKISGVLLIIK